MRLLFYNDSPSYGGHERMMVKLIRRILDESNSSIELLYSPKNFLLRRELGSLGASNPARLLCEASLPPSGSLQGLRTPLARRRIRRLAQRIAQASPDAVVACQGGIASGSTVLLAARQTDCRLVASYLPFVHTVKLMGGRLARLRDWVDRTYYYQLPSRIVLLTERQRAALVARGCNPERVRVFPIFLDPGEIQSRPRAESRAALGLAQNEFVAAVIGRLHLLHKRQDWLVTALAAARAQLRPLRLLIVGSGPDQKRLQAVIERLGVGDWATMVPWISEPARIYAAADVVVIPSRYEGVPLVMAEALLHGLPVLATNIEGPAEFLPPEFLFPPGDASAMAARLRAIQDGPGLQPLAAARSGMERVVLRPAVGREFLSLLT